MGFSASWLALREPADHAARDKGLLRAAVRAAGPAPVILDLGSGTGSTLRAFAPHLSGLASWRLVDNDADLLASARLDNAAASGRGQITTHQMNLRDLAALPLDGATLVTASALLDLCSEHWVRSLARLLADRALPFYAALNYDGIMHWSPPAAADAHVTQAFNRHQRGDKGFGPALGPQAAEAIAAIFGAAGFTVLRAQSPWQLGPQEIALQRELLAGIAAAAAEAGADQAPDWLQARLAALPSGDGFIGHLDILALPPAKSTG